MEAWVKEFYTAQNDWFGAYLGAIEPTHHERADLLEQLTENSSGGSPKRILELGAGGGQTAICLANRGHELTTIELLAASNEHIRKLAGYYELEMQILEGDFYTLPLAEQFEVVYYFDSFGIGDDAEQRLLLSRISDWLTTDGCAIIEVGSTWYWGGVAKGQQLDLGVCMRRHDFDAVNSRIIDEWWQYNTPDQIMRQSLRCYTPADFKMLLEGTGLEFVSLQAGGKIDYSTGNFVADVPLNEAMTYFVTVQKKS